MKTPLILLIVLLSLMGNVAHPADAPNVLFIAIDDLNDWIGCLEGHPDVRTPNIDRLAHRGVLFSNAHCAAPACNPSRAAVFSGLLPHHTGVWSNDSPRLPAHRPELELLPTVFQKAGYLTLGTGKLLHGGAKSSRELFEETFFPEQRWSPLNRGQIDYSQDELPSKKTDNPRHVIRVPNRAPIVLPLNGMPSDRNPNGRGAESFDWGPLDVQDSAMGDAQITDWSIQRIQQGFQKPFFLSVGYYRPHIPLWAPRKYFEIYANMQVNLPPYLADDLDDVSKTAKRWAIEPVTAGAHATVVGHQQWRAAVTAYLACVSFVDHQIGRLLNALDASPYADNTLIVLWSDHGWHLGEKQHWGKWTGWERSTHVPLIVVPAKNTEFHPGSVGATCDQPVSLLDLYPTLTDICGVDAPSKLSGRSLTPLLRKPETTTDRVIITTFDRGNYSLRSESSRYIRYEDGAEELYDLSKDPNEWTNLCRHPDYVEVMATYRKWLAEFLMLLRE